MKPAKPLPRPVAGNAPNNAPVQFRGNCVVVHMPAQEAAALLRALARQTVH